MLTVVNASQWFEVFLEAENFMRILPRRLRSTQIVFHDNDFSCQLPYPVCAGASYNPMTRQLHCAIGERGGHPDNKDMEIFRAHSSVKVTISLLHAFAHGREYGQVYRLQRLLFRKKQKRELQLNEDAAMRFARRYVETLYRSLIVAPRSDAWVRTRLIAPNLVTLT